MCDSFYTKTDFFLIFFCIPQKDKSHSYRFGIDMNVCFCVYYPFKKEAECGFWSHYWVFYEVNQLLVVKLDERHIIEHLVKLLETLWDRIKVLDPFLTALNSKWRNRNPPLYKPSFHLHYKTDLDLKIWATYTSNIYWISKLTLGCLRWTIRLIDY